MNDALEAALVHLHEARGNLSVAVERNVSNVDALIISQIATTITHQIETIERLIKYGV